MARGFESKAVANQQEAAQAAGGVPGPPASEAEYLAKKRRLELSRCDVLRRLESAKAEPHREVLRRGLAALDAELASLAGRDRP